MDIGSLMNAAGLSVAEVSRRSGVARSTLYRIERGEVSPTLGTLREIFLACGLELDIAARPLSDPYAAEGARLLYEEGFTPSDERQAREWGDRIARIFPDDPVDAVEYAARCATLLHRRGAHYHRGPVTTLRVASAGDAAHAPWAISGAPPLGVTGTTVLWSSDADLASALLADAAPRVDRATDAGVVVAHAPHATFHDTWTDGPVRFVAPIQMALDCIGLGGELRQFALDEIRGW